MWSALNFRSKATRAMKLLFFSLSLHETVLLHFALFSFKTELWFPFTAQTFRDKTKVTWHRKREAQGQHDCPCINPWHDIGQYRSSSDWSANQNKGRGGDPNPFLSWHSLPMTIRSVTKSYPMYCHPCGSAVENRTCHLQSVIIKTLGGKALFVLVLRLVVQCSTRIRADSGLWETSRGTQKLMKSIVRMPAFSWI